MIELARVTLNNEMDLIIAHKRSMKIAELSGLSLSAQTTFATAVSEVSRNVIDHGKDGCLILSIDSPVRNEKYIVASIKDKQAALEKGDGFEYAKKLVNKFNISSSENESTIELYFTIPGSYKLNTKQIESWKGNFEEEPPVSPYEEIKRKNEQLQQMAARLQDSESQYKILTNSLPLMIFSLDRKSNVTYANEWMLRFTGLSLEKINESRWRSIIHKEEYDSFIFLIHDKIASSATNIKLQCRILDQHSGQYLWHLVSISPVKDENGRVQYWTGFMADINTQKVYEQTLKDNKELKETQKQLQLHEKNLQHNIQELNRSNIELQQFAFVASHDLQEPVRKIIFYSDFLLSKYNNALDPKGAEYLRNMVNASHRMRNLIRDLLAFSQVNQKQKNISQVNLNQVAHEALQDLELAIKDKRAQVHISSMPAIRADAMLMRQLFENLIGNSIKYARRDIDPVIDVSHAIEDDRIIIYFKDNGIGFDEKYLDKMFTLFQRLHSREEFKGTGLGLAICRKIVELHDGTITARSKPGEGAVFIINLPMNKMVAA